MRGALTLSSLLLVIGCFAQEAERSHQPPTWLGDLTIGGSEARPVRVRTSTNEQWDLNPSGSLSIDGAVEHALHGPWSARAVLGWQAYARGASTSGGDPYATPSHVGDAWHLQLGLVWQALRSTRSQFTVALMARGSVGDDLSVPSSTGTRATWASVHFRYGPAVDPHAEVAWRFKGPEAQMGLVVRAGVRTFHLHCTDVDFARGVFAVPAGLVPLTEDQSGWAFTFAVGLCAW